MQNPQEPKTERGNAAAHETEVANGIGLANETAPRIETRTVTETKTESGAAKTETDTIKIAGNPGMPRLKCTAVHTFHG